MPQKRRRASKRIEQCRRYTEYSATALSSKRTAQQKTEENVLKKSTRHSKRSNKLLSEDSSARRKSKDVPAVSKRYNRRRKVLLVEKLSLPRPFLLKKLGVAGELRCCSCLRNSKGSFEGLTVSDNRRIAHKIVVASPSSKNSKHLEPFPKKRRLSTSRVSSGSNEGVIEEPTTTSPDAVTISDALLSSRNLYFAPGCCGNGRISVNAINGKVSFNGSGGPVPQDALFEIDLQELKVRIPCALADNDYDVLSDKFNLAPSGVPQLPETEDSKNVNTAAGPSGRKRRRCPVADSVDYFFPEPVRRFLRSRANGKDDICLLEIFVNDLIELGSREAQLSFSLPLTGRRVNHKFFLSIEKTKNYASARRSRAEVFNVLLCRIPRTAKAQSSVPKTEALKSVLRQSDLKKQVIFLIKSVPYCASCTKGIQEIGQQNVKQEVVSATSNIKPSESKSESCPGSWVLHMGRIPSHGLLRIQDGPVSRKVEKSPAPISYRLLRVGHPQLVKLLSTSEGVRVREQQLAAIKRNLRFGARQKRGPGRPKKRSAEDESDTPEDWSSSESSSPRNKRKGQKKVKGSFSNGYQLPMSSLTLLKTAIKASPREAEPGHPSRRRPRSCTSFEPMKESRQDRFLNFLKCLKLNHFEFEDFTGTHFRLLDQVTWPSIVDSKRGRPTAASKQLSKNTKKLSRSDRSSSIEQLSTRPSTAKSDVPLTDLMHARSNKHLLELETGKKDGVAPQKNNAKDGSSSTTSVRNGTDDFHSASRLVSPWERGGYNSFSPHMYYPPQFTASPYQMQFSPSFSPTFSPQWQQYYQNIPYYNYWQSDTQSAAASVAAMALAHEAAKRRLQNAAT